MPKKLSLHVEKLSIHVAHELFKTGEANVTFLGLLLHGSILLNHAL
jgi:hypothetical protein